MTAASVSLATGRVTQILGNVVDVAFDAEHVPALYDAIRIQIAGRDEPLILEVEQLLGNNVVRCVGMGPTDGRERGQEAFDTGGPITVPVGPQTLGRIFNVLGQPVDNLPAPTNAPRLPIHRPAPAWRTRLPAPRYSSRASKRLTSSRPSCVAARSAPSAAQASARP